MILYSFLAVVFNALTLIFTKRVFMKFKNFNHQSFAWWLFIWIILLSLILAPWLVSIKPIALSSYYIWLLLALAFLSANHNLLYYYGLRYEKLTEAEPFLLFNPVVAIVIASAFYADERSWHVYVAAVLASLILGWAHSYHRHLRLSRPLLAILGFSLIYGVEAVVIKQLLAVYSPLALYLVRAIVTVLFLWIVEQGKIKKINLKQVPYFLIIAASAIVASIFVYMSYSSVGIGFTMAILFLSPILVYFASVIYLKEKLRWRSVLSSLVIVGIIIWLALVR